MSRYLLAGTAFLCALLALVVTQQNEECIKYCGPKIDTTALVGICIPTSVPNCSTCRFFDNLCPEVQQCDLVPSADGRCLVCRGEVCAYDKKGYKAYEEISSFDEVNKCTCMPDGKVVCNATQPVPYIKLCEHNI